jgi:hypothetical protein
MTALPNPTLAQLGLRQGERVRFRRPDRARWQPGTVHRRERDGSVRITDTNGAARAIPIQLVQVRCAGPRGAMGWEPLLDRATRTEQLSLL